MPGVFSPQSSKGNWTVFVKHVGDSVMDFVNNGLSKKPRDRPIPTRFVSKKSGREVTLCAKVTSTSNPLFPSNADNRLPFHLYLFNNWRLLYPETGAVC